MEDQNVIDRINALSTEEERLYERAGHEPGGLSAEERARLERIGIELERAQDLLNQRTARRAAGLDPDAAHLRSEEVVEGYEQ
jgi:hypothetical protein